MGDWILISEKQPIEGQKILYVYRDDVKVGFFGKFSFAVNQIKYWMPIPRLPNG